MCPPPCSARGPAGGRPCLPPPSAHSPHRARRLPLEARLRQLAGSTPAGPPRGSLPVAERAAQARYTRGTTATSAPAQPRLPLWSPALQQTLPGPHPLTPAEPHTPAAPPGPLPSDPSRAPHSSSSSPAPALLLDLAHPVKEAGTGTWPTAEALRAARAAPRQEVAEVPGHTQKRSPKGPVPGWQRGCGPQSAPRGLPRTPPLNTKAEPRVPSCEGAVQPPGGAEERHEEQRPLFTDHYPAHRSTEAQHMASTPARSRGFLRVQDTWRQRSGRSLSPDRPGQAVLVSTSMCWSCEGPGVRSGGGGETRADAGPVSARQRQGPHSRRPPRSEDTEVEKAPMEPGWSPHPTTHPKETGRRAADPGAVQSRPSDRQQQPSKPRSPSPAAHRCSLLPLYEELWTCGELGPRAGGWVRSPHQGLRDPGRTQAWEPGAPRSPPPEHAGLQAPAGGPEPQQVLRQQGAAMDGGGRAALSPHR
ncbi:PREDICTED: basic salivary proline-rich protein 2-like [Dipodomys ordii]|uniref:Basic salivary proline-rich protein 2-like n=1 Tax=Dipodomys ordii TaxID=10020 RepID=A0A1S3GQB9_DIPOR|nr:PREDICTED: basic salivary proline-rich protein 2-like [Dipodomys ordii]